MSLKTRNISQSDFSMNDNKGPNFFKNKQKRKHDSAYLFFVCSSRVLSALTRTDSGLWEETQHGRLLVYSGCKQVTNSLEFHSISRDDGACRVCMYCTGAGCYVFTHTHPNKDTHTHTLITHTLVTHSLVTHSLFSTQLI